jgi:hypothetical protein
MLTVSTFRSLLGAGLGLEANVAGYIDALQARRLLPADGVSLNARAVAIALLAIVSGLPPVEAAREALRSGIQSRRHDAAHRSAEPCGNGVA